MIEEVLQFWFGEPATTTDELGRKIRRWYMGGPALDTEIRDRFGGLVERALAGELEGWTQTTRGRLALIILLDQFTRSVYRNDRRTYDGDPKAQSLASEALDRGLDRELALEERLFLTMPLLHAEDLALQERSVATLERLAGDAAEFQKPTLAMAVEQGRKYRDLIARYGRFPHRNAVLGRTSTPAETEFLADGEAQMRPRGSDNLPA